MFYITDYITKNDEKLHQVLALLSCAVAATPTATEDMTSKDHARLLIIKCLTAMMRNKRIHGQQAARYLRNTGDTIPSHKTKPMLSSSVVHYVTKCYKKSLPTLPAHKSPLYKKGDVPLEDNTDQQFGGAEEEEECDSEGDLDPNEEEESVLILNQSISSFIEGRMDCFTNAPSLKIIYIVTNFLPMCLSMILSIASEKREKGVLSRRKVGNTKGTFSSINIKNIIHTCYWKQSEKPMFAQSMRLFQGW